MKILQNILVSIAFFIFWLVISAVLWFGLFFNVIPCSWIGSGFEGGCGYGAIGLSLLFTGLSTVIGTIINMLTYTKSKKNL